MAKVEIPGVFMPPVEHAEHASDVDMRHVGNDAKVPIAIVLEAAGHVYAYVQYAYSVEYAEGMYSNAFHVLGCDCGRSAAIQQLAEPAFDLLPCGHTLRLIALEALPQPVTVQCPRCQTSFEVEL